MTMLAFASLRGAPGVTTTAMIAAQLIAQRGLPTLLVEADCDAPVLTALLPELDPAGSVLAAAAAARRGSSKAISQTAQALGDNLRVLVGAPVGAQTANSLPLLTQTLRDISATVIIDCGRVGAPASKLFMAADHRFLLTAPTRHDLLALAALHNDDPASAGQTHTVIVGKGPYATANLDEVGITVLTHRLPDQPRAAATALGQTGKGSMSAKAYRKSKLVRAVGDMLQIIFPPADPSADPELESETRPATPPLGADGPKDGMEGFATL
jgi:hypothetical protein